MLKIYRALKTNIITQKFGENLWTGYVRMGMLGHNGIDFACWRGESIYWDCNKRGKVLNTETDSNGGLGVNVITEDGDGIFKHRFWHLKSFACEAGQVLESGDLMGYGDMTGVATGDHLHRDLKEMYKDPKTGAYKTKNYDNGYFGAIDYMPYFQNTFIVDYVDMLKKQIPLFQQIIEAMKKIIKLQIEIKLKVGK